MRRLLACALLAAAPAFAEQFPCPERYPAKEVHIAEVPHGWHGYGTVRAGRRLSGAGMILGAVELRGELRGSDRKTRDGHEVRFDMDPASAEGKWVYCGYGEVELLRRVPDGTTECVVKHRRRKWPESLDIEVTCR